MKTFYVEIHALTGTKLPVKVHSLLNVLLELCPLEKKSVFVDRITRIHTMPEVKGETNAYRYRGDIFEITIREADPKADLLFYVLGDYTSIQEKQKHAEKFTDQIITEIGGIAKFIPIRDNKDILVEIHGCDLAGHQRLFQINCARVIH